MTRTAWTLLAAVSAAAAGMDAQDSRAPLPNLPSDGYVAIISPRAGDRVAYQVDVRVYVNVPNLQSVSVLVDGALLASQTPAQAQPMNRGLLFTFPLNCKTRAGTTELRARAVRKDLKRVWAKPVHFFVGLTLKALNLVYDPKVPSQGGEKEIRIIQGWFDWRKTTPQYIDEISTVSKGFVKHVLADTLIVDGYPPQRSEFVITDASYQHVIETGGYLSFIGPAHKTRAGPLLNAELPLGKDSDSMQLGQSFIPFSDQTNQVQIALARVGNPAQDIVVSIRDRWDGRDLASVTIAAEDVKSRSLTELDAWVWKALPCGIPKRTTLYLVLRADGVSDSKNYYTVGARRGSSYPDGHVLTGSRGTPLADHDLGAQLMMQWGVDYPKMLNDLGIPGRVKRGEFDTVLINAPPWVGFWETAWAGPGDIYTNGGKYPEVDSGRGFLLVGIGYEHVGANPLHNMGHHIETTLSRVYGLSPLFDPCAPGRVIPPNRPINNWTRFTTHKWESGSARGVGTVHCPPNAQGEYDYANTRQVPSYADTFYDYPRIDLSRVKQVSVETWSRAFPRNNTHWSYQLWWLDHLPANPGVGPDGKLNNWWRYVYMPWWGFYADDLQQ
jgi:hypothetical protein